SSQELINYVSAVLQTCRASFTISSSLAHSSRIIRRNRIKPTALESRPRESGDDRRATAHDVPKQACPVVLDHQHDRPLIDSKVIGRDPPASRTILDNKRLIERRLEPVFRRHSQVHLRKMPYGRDDDFRSKRQ